MIRTNPHKLTIAADPRSAFALRECLRGAGGANEIDPSLARRRLVR